MRRIGLILFSVILLAVLIPTAANAQQWSGILDPSRAINWSGAGVTGGIPSRTTICATLNGGASASAINSAISACPANQVVFLNAGAYNLSAGINMKSNVTLRGAGANSTFLTFSSQSGACAAICFEGDNTWNGASENQPGAAQAATWTGGFSQGATQITLSNIGSSGIKVGQYIYLDQGDVSVPTGNFFICGAGCSLEGPNGSRVVNGLNHGQTQIVKVTGISGSTYTISPGLYGTNWGTGKDPGAWWAATQLQFAGVENLSIDDTPDDGTTIVAIYNSFNCWVSGIRSLYPTRDHVQYGEAAHNTVQNNYFYGTKNAASQSYGVESYLGSDNLTVNNIFQRVSSPMMTQITMGNVFLYNFDVLDYYCSNGSSGCNDNANGVNTMGQTTLMHGAGVAYTLWEGNVTPGYKGDAFHGSGGLQTIFRNQVFGYAPYVGTNGTASFTLWAYNRAYNIIGNVLGKTGFSTSYQNGGGGEIYDLGSGASENSVTIPSDSGVATTLLRWGNFDVVNNAVRFVASEVPTGIGAYANAVPASQTLPASLYYTSVPSWWPAGKPWPLIGPDVTGGNVPGYGGHANTNPAQDCYSNVMKGPADGTGSVLSFNASTCYSSVPLPAAPTGVAGVAH